MMQHSQRYNEETLLAKFAMTLDDVEHDVAQIEDESVDDNLIGLVHYGLHMRERSKEPLASMTIKLPQSQLTRITKAAEQYLVSRSEYVRRRLAEVL